MTSLFADVPNRDAPPPEAAWAGRVAPMDAAAAAAAHAVVPVDDVLEMTLQWVLPVCVCVEREGEGEGEGETVSRHQRWGDGCGGPPRLACVRAELMRAGGCGDGWAGL